MRPALHPTFHTDTVVTCACGSSFVTGSTKPRLHVETCSACHPFFAGATRAAASTQIDRFNARYPRLLAPVSLALGV
jgi:large subunit ribosomal protein L31